MSVLVMSARQKLPLKWVQAVQKIKAEKKADGSRIKEADIVTLMQSVHIHTVDTALPEDVSRYVIHPKAYILRNFWDPLIRLLAIMFFLEVPFTIAFHPEHSIGTSLHLVQQKNHKLDQWHATSVRGLKRDV